MYPKRIRVSLAALVVAASGATVPAHATVVSVPRALDGATGAYTFTFSRLVTSPAALPAGSGALSLRVHGGVPVTDAAGEPQLARRYRFEATGMADLVSGSWEKADGIFDYALDPVSGEPVQTSIDADLDWASGTTSRLAYDFSLNWTSFVEEYPDTLLPLVRILDTFGGRSYAPGDRIVAGPGHAMFLAAGAPTQIVIGGGGAGRGGGGGGQQPPQVVTALPLAFALSPNAAIDVSGTAYILDGRSLPARIDLRIHSLLLATDLATMTLTAGELVEGEPLPDLPAFTHPTVRAGAETSADLATGSRPSSWTPSLSIEQVVAASASSETVQSYRALHPEAFVSAVIDHEASEVSALGGVLGPDVRELARRAWGEPLWFVFWDAPGASLRAVTAVAKDRVTGELVVSGQVQGGGGLSSKPARTLTVSQAIALAEEHSPSAAATVASSSLLVHLSTVNAWIVVRGQTYDLGAALDDASLLVNWGQTFSAYTCARFPPAPGTQVLVEGAGLALGAIEARYHTPRTAQPAQLAECGRSIGSILVGDPTTSETQNGLLRAGQTVADSAETFTDPSKRAHAPIVIDADSDFSAPSSVSGVVSGSGTRDDPYVISGWNLRPDDAGNVPAISLIGTSRHVLIRDNVLHGTRGFGILVERAKNVRIEDNRFLGLSAGVVVLGLTNGAIARNRIADSGTGVHVQNHIVLNDDLTIGATPVEDLRILDNVVERPHAIGIGYHGAYGRMRSNQIRGNRVSGGYIGLGGLRPEGAVVAGNRYSGNRFGIFLQDGSGLEIRDELIAGAAIAGIYLKGTTGVVLANPTVEDIGGYGIWAERARATVAGARVDAAGRGIVATFGAVLEVRGSAFTRNSAYAAYAYDSAVDAAQNWWGSPTGPSGCAFGSGERISCGVAHDGHLLSEP